MKKIILITGLLAFCFAVRAQSNPEDLTEIDKPAAPVKKNVERVNPPDKVFTAVEVAAEYPGGTAEMQKFFNANLRYPKAALKRGIQGRVITKFVIEKDGSVAKAEVVQGIGGGCDEEAIRLLKAMPKWKPGSQSGHPVKVYYTLPITFTLGR